MNAAPTLSETLGAFTARTDFAALPPAVVARAKVSLVHNLALAVAGRVRENLAHAMAERLWATPAEATLLHTGARVSVEAAAFANAALIHTRSQDDTHAGSTSHPGGVVMPAALAIAEQQQRSGAEFLTGLVLGYEILCRIGRDFDHLMTARGFRAAPVVGGFGAAAAAAKLMQLPAAQTAHAIGLASHLAGGLGQVWVEGSAEWPLQLGFAARNGVIAARTAQAGAVAGRFTLEGKGGFFRAYAGATDAPTEILQDLGEAWQFSEVTVKPHPVCAILQGPLDALLALMRAHRIDPAMVTEATLALSPYEAGYPGIDNAGPIVSETAAKMSAQFSLALALIDRRVSIEGLHRFADPAIAAVSAKIRVVAEPTLQERRCRIALRLNDGRAVTGEIATPVGQPDFTQIADFAAALAGEIGAPATIFDALIDAVDRLDRAPDLTALLAAIVGPPARQATSPPRALEAPRAPEAPRLAVLKSS